MFVLLSCHPSIVLKAERDSPKLIFSSTVANYLTLVTLLNQHSQELACHPMDASHSRVLTHSCGKQLKGHNWKTGGALRNNLKR